MRTILLSGLLLVTTLGNSQSKKVTIIGNLPQLYGGEYVSFSKPIGKFSILWDYIDDKDNAKLNEGKFVANLDIDAPGIIAIYEKPFNGNISIRFFAEPGDTVFVEREKGEILFKGKNAIVNKMLSNIEIPRFVCEKELDILKNSATAKEVIDELNRRKIEYSNKYKDFFDNKQISKACLDYVLMLMECSIDGQARYLCMNYEEFSKQTKYFSMTKEEANKIVEYVDAKYQSYKTEYLTSPYFWFFVKKIGLVLEEKCLKENKKIERFWNQFDKIMDPILPNFGVVDYLEENEYKEYYIGDLLLGSILNKNLTEIIKYKDFVAIYKAFASKFPSSAYIIPLSKSIVDLNLNSQSINQSATVISKPKTRIGNLVSYDTNFETIGTTAFAKSDQSLVKAMIEKFPNQDVFIDFWATWCGPCHQQFIYNNELHTFLDSKNVKTLYVSYDEGKDITKWEKYIEDYNLTGYHFLGSKTYQEKFLNTLTQMIPRYFIYNSRAGKIQVLEDYPKDKEKFYANITKALSIK